MRLLNLELSRPEPAFLEKFLRQSSVFHALIRSIECRYVSRVDIKPPVLDLGCGDGMFGSILFDCKPDAIDCGIDLSPKDIQKARETRTYRLLQVADIQKLPFAENSIGSIFSNSVFEHLEDIDAALREAFRVLRPGGKLVMTAPNDRVADNFLISSFFRAIGLNRVGRSIGDFGNRVLGNRHCLSNQHWKQKAGAAGFRTVDCSTLVPPRIFHIAELFMPFSIFSVVSRRLFGRLLFFERRLSLKPLQGILKKAYTYDGNEGGLATLVVAIK